MPSSRYTPNNQSRNTLLFTPHGNLGRHSILCGVSHPYHSSNLATIKRFAIQLESMSARGNTDVAAI